MTSNNAGSESIVITGVADEFVKPVPHPTPIVLDLTKASMLSHFQFRSSKKIPQAHALATLGNKLQLRGPATQMGLSASSYGNHGEGNK